jgi:hypothetical protein
LLFPSLAFSKDLSQYFKNQFSSRYFVFHYNDEIKTIPSFARFSDSFIEVINRDYFRADFNYPIHVYVLKDQDSMNKFLKQRAGVDDNDLFGIYLPRFNGFVTREDSGYGTFAHEILHPLIAANLKKIPRWADEGLPSFFEKFFGYYDNNSAVMYFGFQNPWRIEKLGDKLLSLDLKDIVNFGQKYGTSEKRLVSVFLYKNGKLIKFIDAVKTNNKNGYKTFFEAAFEKNMQDITPLWKTYLKEIIRDREKILKIPMSRVFDSKESFESFMKTNDLPY